MPEGELSITSKSYLAITLSFVEGLKRIFGAEAAFSRLALTLTTFHLTNKMGLDGPAAPILENLNHIEYSSYAAYKYVTNISHLVYATTLFDTFLSDTTMFLFLSFPNSMGKNQQISIQNLLNSSSRNDALTKAAASRTREISFLSLVSRIDFLRETFGLNIIIDDEINKTLNHCATTRNVAIHDQGIFELKLDDNNQIQFHQKTNAQFPTQVSDDDVKIALKTYQIVVGKITSAIFTQILNIQDPPILKSLLEKDDA